MLWVWLRIAFLSRVSASTIHHSSSTGPRASSKGHRHCGSGPLPCANCVFRRRGTVAISKAWTTSTVQSDAVKQIWPVSCSASIAGVDGEAERKIGGSESWRNGSVGKVPAMQACRPKLKCQNPCEHPSPGGGGVQIGSILVSLTGQPGLFGEFRPGLLGERPYLKITSWGVGSGEMA